MKKRTTRDVQRQRLYDAERAAWKAYGSMRVDSDFDLPSFDVSQLVRVPLPPMPEGKLIAKMRAGQPDGVSVMKWHRSLGRIQDADQRAHREWRLQVVLLWLHEIETSRWWRNRYGSKRIRLMQDYNGDTWSRAFWHLSSIAIAKGHEFKAWIVLHEIAHLVTPDDVQPHGREFARNYLALVRQFVGPEAAACLRASFVEGKVRHTLRRGPGNPEVLKRVA